MWGLWKKLQKVLAGLFILLVVVLIVLRVGLSTEFGRSAVAKKLGAMLTDSLGITVDLDEVSIGLSGQITIVGLRIRDSHGETPIALERASGKVNLPRVLSGAINVSNLQIEGARVQVYRDQEGDLSLVSMFADGGTTPHVDESTQAGGFLQRVRVRGRILASTVTFTEGSSVSVALTPIEADVSLDWRKPMDSVRVQLALSDTDLHAVLSDLAIDQTASVSGVLVYDQDRILIEDLHIETAQQLRIVVGRLQYSLASGHLIGGIEARGEAVLAQQMRIWTLRTVVEGEDAQQAIRLYVNGFLGSLEMGSLLHVQMNTLSVDGRLSLRGVNMAALVEGAPMTDWSGDLKGSWVNQEGHPKARVEWAMIGAGHPLVGGGLGLRSLIGSAQLERERLKLGSTALFDEGWLKANLSADFQNGALAVEASQLELAIHRNPVPGMTPAFVNPGLRAKASIRCSGRYPGLQIRALARVEEPTQSPLSVPLLNVEVSLRNVPGAPQGHAQIVVPTMTIEERRIDDIQTRIDWKGDALRVALTGTSTVGDISGEGMLSGLLSPEMSFSGKGRFSATTTSQGLPKELFIRKATWTGSGDVRDSHLSGRADLAVDGSLGAEALSGGLAVRAFERTWTATAGLQLARGGSRLRLSAEGRRAAIVSPSQLAALIEDGSIELDDFPVALLKPWLERADMAELSGQLAARLSIHSAKRYAGGHVAFRRIKTQPLSPRTDGRIDINLQPNTSYMRLRATQGSGELRAIGSIRAGFRDALQGRIRVLPRRSIHLTAQLAGLDLDELARQFNLVACGREKVITSCGFPAESISGSLAATATLAGSLTRPRGRLEISTSSFTMDEVSYGDLQAKASLSDEVFMGQVRTLDARSGQLSFDLEKRAETYKARILADQWSVAPLELLFRGSQRVGKMQGLLSGKLSADGESFSRAPQIHGSLVLKEGGVQLAAPLPALSSAGIKMEMRGTEGYVAWDAIVSRGKANGTITVDWKNDVNLKMSAETTDMLASVNGFPAMVNMVADATGTMKDGEAKIAIQLSDGKVRLASGFSRKLHPTELPEELQDSVFGRTTTGSVAQANVLPIRIALTTRNPILVRSPDVQGGLTLDLSYRSMPIEQFRGSARLANGFLRLGGRDWVIVKAVLHFTEDHEPTLDVELDYQDQQALVRLYLRGTPSKPELTLGSSPSIFDQASLMAFVLGGELDSQRGTGASATGGLISGLLSNAVSSEVEGLLPIDTIVLDPTSHARLGKWIFSQVFLAYQRNFDPREDENLTEGIVRYNFLPGWMVESRFGDRGVGSVDLLWQKRF